MTTKTTGEAEAPATNVVEAWRRVMRDMPNVGKDNRMEQGQKYNYRSIEQFTGHAAGLFAQHGVIVMPLGQEITYHDVGKTQSGALILEARGTWNWRIYGPGGREDYLDATSFGEGRDTSDKAAQKCATSAFKYLLMPALMISDSKDDPDHERIEGGGAQPPAPAPTPEEQAQAEFDEMVYQLCVDLKKLDGGDGPHIEALLGTVGGRTVNDIKKWIAANPEIAHDTVETLLRQLKAKQEMNALDAASPETAPEMPPEPPKPPRAPRTRAKPGSAVSPETEAAADAVIHAFPGATEE